MTYIGVTKPTLSSWCIAALFYIFLRYFRIVHDSWDNYFFDMRHSIKKIVVISILLHKIAFDEPAVARSM